jgi:predicted dehydrogenase/threonine dehydrogenase-like Zn-dependent dehydrogenase
MDASLRRDESINQERRTRMKQIIEDLKSGTVRLTETPVPQCGSTEILVRNEASLISPGTEKLMIELGKKSLAGKARSRPDLVKIAYHKAKKEGFLNVYREAMARLDQPMPLGYSCAGEIIEIGKKVSGFRVGDRVACAGAAFASHAEYVAVPQELAVVLPAASKGKPALGYDEAAFVMLGGIALEGVRCAKLTFGESVAVVGLGLIGLITAQIAKAYGCNVIGVDVDPSKVRLAGSMGCDTAFSPSDGDAETIVAQHTGGQGADAVIITAATTNNAPILLAERVCRRKGRIVLVGVADLALTRKMFWDKELSFTVSKASGPSVVEYPHHMPLPPELSRWTERRNLEEFISLLSSGRVSVSSLITHRYALPDALKAYDVILTGKQKYVGVLIEYGKPEPPGRTVRVKAPEPPGAAGDRTAVGLIGAGMFTRNVLMPRAANVKGIRCAGVAAKTGLNARYLADRFHFGYATSDYHRILDDPEIGSVIITTRHDAHAPMVAAAIRAGKRVFVEKPLCISSSQLDEIVAAGSKRPANVFVGFNRRYAPLSRQLKDRLALMSGPMQILFRVNAGYIPDDHWTQDLHVGGGRIIGEVCHFIDLMQFFTGARPISVFTAPIGMRKGKYRRDDNVSLAVSFSDGSLGTIIYSAQGAKTFSREHVEVYAEGTVAVIEDFKTLDIAGQAGRKTTKLWNQDMGYEGELHAFFVAPEDIFERTLTDAIVTTKATFAAMESLRAGIPVSVDDARWEP